MVRVSDGEWRVGALAACAGLQSDRVARACGVTSDIVIAPFSVGKGCETAARVVIDHFEDLYLGALLERCRGNVALAARQAKMNRSYLTRMIKRRGIERP